MNQRIWVIRHGKSARPFGVLDQNRPLAKRASEDATLIRGWLGSGPTLFVPSSAARAVQTAQLLTDDVPVLPSADLYVASPGEFLGVIEETLAGHRDDHVAFIGHNPTVTSLVNHLARRMLTDSVPTLGVAAFENVGGRWQLLDYVTPKELR
ncbi:MAG: hypothetical protein F4029_20275 [Gammaproteobacteria bacterium]|nr:hypothetical protein [Gammaproteobacteria bacterium]MYF30102.1 hypothetical protein [Gammaproteobacteria bacterium]MYK48551.1 hypothetical protein [Gammaproteobacteria bacterium]